MREVSCRKEIRSEMYYGESQNHILEGVNYGNSDVNLYNRRRY